MDELIRWLELNLNPSLIIQDLVLFPVIAGLLAWLLHAAFLWGAQPQRRERLRSKLAYFALLPAITLLIGIWRSALRLIVAAVGDRGPGEAARMRSVLNSVLYAALCTAALALLVHLVRRLVSKIVRRVNQWAGQGGPIRLKGLELVSRDRVRDAVLILTRVWQGLLILVLLYIYIPLVLGLFPATAPLADQLLLYVARPAAEIGKAIIGYIPNLLYITLMVIAVRYALKATRFFLNALGRGDLVFSSFEPEWADPTYKLARTVLVVFTLIIVYPLLPGSGSDAFKGFSIFFGAVFTLGSTTVVGNLVSGIILTYSRAFRIGDRVRIGESEGDVVAKSLFVSRIRTTQNEEISIPNSLVLSGQLVNYTNAAKRNELVLVVEVGIGYEVRWTKLERLLQLAASQTPGIVESPAPYVWVKTLGDFAVVYQLRAFTDRADLMGATYSALRKETLDVLHDAGVEIMTPAVRAVRDASQAAVPAAAGDEGSGGPGGIRVEIAERAPGSE